MSPCTLNGHTLEENLLYFLLVHLHSCFFLAYITFDHKYTTNIYKYTTDITFQENCSPTNKTLHNRPQPGSF